MGNLTAAAPISPLGSFWHRWGSHSTEAPALMHSCTLSPDRGRRWMWMWSHHSLHTHFTAVLVGCLGWGSLLDSWLLASLQGACGNIHEDDPKCSYSAYQEAQAIGINQIRKKNPISDRKTLLLDICSCKVCRLSWAVKDVKFSHIQIWGHTDVCHTSSSTARCESLNTM